MRCLGNAGFSAYPVVCKEPERRTTTLNGFSIPPPAVNSVGRFPRLAALQSPYLCQYLEIIRCREAPSIVAMISEHYAHNLSDKLNILTVDEKLQTVAQISAALDYLHTREIYSGFVDVSTVELTTSDDEQWLARLSQYGTSYITGYGEDQARMTGNQYCRPPERMVDEEVYRGATEYGDVWALGIVCLQLLIGITLKELCTEDTFATILIDVLRIQDGRVFENLLQRLKETSSAVVDVDGESLLFKIADRCLQKLPRHRPDASAILECLKEKGVVPKPGDDGFNEWSQMKEAISKLAPEEWILRELPIKEAWFLWKLCGSQVESLLVRNEIIKLDPPIVTLPSIIINEFHLFEREGPRRFYVDKIIFKLPCNNLRMKLRSLNPRLMLHSFELDGDDFPSEGEDLPVIVKEKDFTYQCTRINAGNRLVDAFSFKAEALRKLVATDIPPMIRPKVWAALLNVTEASTWTFEDLDTFSSHPSDSQLEVDIPRCHQYEELMTSATAQAKLKRLVKAYLRGHPECVYWQGLDSVAAPFLLLYFEDMPRAFACMSAFITKYMHNVFIHDNIQVIGEYFHQFEKLLAYTDAELWLCMQRIQFFPELYAIRWFLTCFAHVLPLHKLFHVWDRLLLCDVHFPLCIGLGIFAQLRGRLVKATFNDAILLFSDLPFLDMEKVIEEAVRAYSYIPKSCAFRFHGSDNQGPVKEHTMQHLTPAQLRECVSPRMSREDLIARIEKQAVLLLDIRTAPEYNRVSVIRSISFPHYPVGDLSNIQNLLNAAQENKHPICIMDGGMHMMASAFAKRLVEEKTTCCVCILDGGFDGMRNFQHLLQVGQF
ncbi:unnamed protein product, partial [Mesorhabditis spiculigera]